MSRSLCRESYRHCCLLPCSSFSPLLFCSLLFSFVLYCSLFFSSVLFSSFFFYIVLFSFVLLSFVLFSSLLCSSLLLLPSILISWSALKKRSARVVLCFTCTVISLNSPVTGRCYIPPLPCVDVIWKAMQRIIVRWVIGGQQVRIWTEADQTVEAQLVQSYHIMSCHVMSWKWRSWQ